MLAGNVAALLSPMIFIPILTVIFGFQNYDYETMRAIRKVDDSDVAAAAHVDLELIPGAEPTTNNSGEILSEAEEKEKKKLDQAAFWARTLTVVMTICLLVLWPMPLYGSGYIFSKQFFTGWVVVGLIWLFGTAFGVILFPLYEGRANIVRVVRSMLLDVSGKKNMQHPELHEGQDVGGEGGDMPSTPEEKVSFKGEN
jgi:urea-proton symporter